MKSIKSLMVATLAALLLLIGLNSAAFASSTVNAYSSGSGNGFAYSDSIGGTKLPVGSVVQLIIAAGGTIHAPNADGTPGGGDILSKAGSVAGAPGLFYLTKTEADNAVVYVRVWNGPTLADATKYGDSSATYTVHDTTPPAPLNWSISNGIVTTNNKPTATPTVAGINPSSGSQGSTLNVTISGTNTTWSGDMRSAIQFSNSGITVNSATATNGTTISANITIAAGAAIGAGTMTVTGASGSAAFTVTASGTPILSGINPASGTQGQTLNVTLTGSSTNWSGSPTVVFSGSGITVNSATATSATTISANITIAASAPTGARTVMVNGTNGTVTFNVNAAAVPTLSNISPNTGLQGQNLTVNLIGSNTNWSGSQTVVFSGSGITVNSATVTDPTMIAANITVAAGAALGTRTVMVDGTNGTVNFTVVSSSTPALISISPASGAQGTSNLSVAIVGANVNWSGNMASSIQISGTGVTVVNATATSTTNINATLAIASDASLGAHNVSVTGVSNSLVFTVNQGGTPNPTAIIIDDFEGTCVGKWATQADGGYYTFQNGMITPDNNIITAQGPQAEALMNGLYGMKVRFSYVANSDPTKDWGDGWGGQLRTVKDLSAMKSVTMNMRWDGSTNMIKFGFQDSQGHVYVANIPNSALMAVTTYGKLSLPLSAFAEDTTNLSRTVGAIDWAHITNYTFAYANKGTTTNYQFIDDITALTTDEVNPQPGGTPVINSITPNQAPTGATINVAGLNFGTAQGMSSLTFTNSLSGTSYPASIVSWSDTAITARVPSLAPVGSYEVVVNKLASSQGIVTVQTSNQRPFQVTASGVDTVRAYPNPFNPNVEIITLVYTPPAGASNIDVYIYDMTARLVSKTNVGGASQTTWDGKDQQGNLAGDGAYLVRVVNGDTKSLIAKGKVLVVKH